MWMCVHTQTGLGLLLLVCEDHPGKDHSEEKNKFLCTEENGDSICHWCFLILKIFSVPSRGSRRQVLTLWGRNQIAGLKNQIRCWGGCCWKLAEPGSIPSLWNADPPRSETSNLSSKRRMICGFLMVFVSTQTMFFPTSPPQNMSWVRPLTQSTKTSLLV